MSDRIGESQIKLGCLLQDIENELQARRVLVGELLSEMLAVEQAQRKLAIEIDNLKVKHGQALRDCQRFELQLARAREEQL